MSRLLLIVLLFNTANAQPALGVEAGYTHNDYNGAASAGFQAGVRMQYAYSKSLHVQTGVQWMQKNYTLQRTGAYAGIYQSFKNTWLQLPVSVLIQLGKKKIGYYGKAGGYVAYWLAGRTKGRIPNILNSYNSNGTDYFILTPYNEQYHFQSNKDRRFGLGWLATAGITYRLTARTSLFIETAYYDALTSQLKKYTIDQTKAYNRTFVCSAGYMLSLPCKK